MNTPIVQNTQLPAHLQRLLVDPRFAHANQALSSGISAGGWPRISIKGSRFRLQSPQGEEVVVQDVFLDIVVIDANPNGVSKIYYAGAYDPAVDEKAPDCYSDNGVGPSSKAAKPQCGTCVACPHNVWGSKINPSGTQGKSCADIKKVAVLIANNPEGPVFELRIPPASLKNWAAYVDSLSKRNIPGFSLVTRLSFDTNADYPKLTFAAQSWATADQAAVVAEVIGTEEVDQCTGKNDKPVQGPVSAIAAPIAQPQIAVQNAIAAQSLPPADLFSQPQPSQQAVEKPKRGRKPKEATFTPAPVDLVVEQPKPAFLNTPVHGAVINPPVSDLALDALIANAMKV